MTSTTLIGHSGFVGQNLCSCHQFQHVFNSKTIADICGLETGLLVISGIPAVKWIANQNPEADKAAIQGLMSNLCRVATATEVILISTIDVYPCLSGADEDVRLDVSTPNHAYGTNRLWAEEEVHRIFKNSVVRIVRLPALFGPGLKKNALFDLLQNKQVETINLDSTFQWYDLTELWADIERLRATSLERLNLFTQPIAMRDIVQDLFADTPGIGVKASPAQHYDLRTKHAELRGNAGPYWQSSSEILTRMRRFITTERGRLQKEAPR